MVELKVTSLPNKDEKLVITNSVYLNPEDCKSFKTSYVEITLYDPTALKKYKLARDRNLPFTALKRICVSFQKSNDISPGEIGLNGLHRKYLFVSLKDSVTVTDFKIPEYGLMLTSIKFQVDFRSKSSKEGEFEGENLATAIKNLYMNQIFGMDQQVTTEVKGTKLIFTVSDIEYEDTRSDNGELLYKINVGMLNSQTQLIFEKGLSSAIRIKGEGTIGKTTLFNKEFNFSDLGIGGLDREFQQILRRAFTSRVYPAKIARNIGLKHVKGILLYGPPGTGKTLIARQIGKMLNAKEPKLVNGPEILNKYVGESEKNIRELFSDAEAEQLMRGDDSDLHIIIFDELDAICKQRGSGSQGGTGVGDSVVNQLLSKLQGVNELNNILVIGMTNRKDMIDDALLRPGRLEVHLEINLPDQYGREQIFSIHTANMRKHGYLGEDVSLTELATKTKNYSGAEIEGVVRSAASFAMSRKIDILNPSKLEDPDSITVTKHDFELALEEVRPAFGISDDSIEKRIKNGIVEFSSTFKKVLNECKMYVDQVKYSDRTPLMSILLEGVIGCGKTALACKIATESDFPYIKVISPDDLVGCSETVKVAKIGKVFENAYKSPFSIIILDEIERILDYVRIGPRFSNVVLQALFVYMKKQPEHLDRKLLVIGTTSSSYILEEMEIIKAFDARIVVPNVYGPEELRNVLEEYEVLDIDTKKILKNLDRIQFPIKKIIMAIEMSKYGKEGDFADRFIEALKDYQ